MFLNFIILYSALKNLLLRKDNSDFKRKVEEYDKSNPQTPKVDRKLLGAYGVSIVRYHDQKKNVPMMNKEILISLI